MEILCSYVFKMQLQPSSVVLRCLSEFGSALPPYNTSSYRRRPCCTRLHTFQQFDRSAFNQLVQPLAVRINDIADFEGLFFLLQPAAIFPFRSDDLQLCVISSERFRNF